MGNLGIQQGTVEIEGEETELGMEEDWNMGKD